MATPQPLPSVAAYKDAFEQLRLEGGISEQQLTMLRAQYQAPGHTLTATQMGEAAGYDKNGANLQHGLLAKELTRLLNYRTEKWKVEVLSTVIIDSDPSVHWLLKMHEPVVLALEALGWFST
jgi:hypothetical protein